MSVLAGNKNCITLNFSFLLRDCIQTEHEQPSFPQWNQNSGQFLLWGSLKSIELYNISIVQLYSLMQILKDIELIQYLYSFILFFDDSLLSCIISTVKSFSFVQLD